MTPTTRAPTSVNPECRGLQHADHTGHLVDLVAGQREHGPDVVAR